MAALEGFIPTIWSGRVLMQLEKAHVFGAVCNRDWEGEISESGDTVRINMMGDINVSDYTPDSTTVTVQKIDDAAKFLKVDQKKYFAFSIDDVIAAQTKPKIMTAAMDKAAYKLRDSSDTYVASLYGQAGIVYGLGTSATPIDITSVNVVDYIGMVGQKMDEANIPPENRWGVMAPWMFHKLTLADITLNTDNSGIISSGFQGSFLGFTLYKSNNTSVGTALTGADTRNMFGYRESITMAEQILKMKAYEPEGNFSQAVKGLYVYGVKVVRPEALACLRTDYTVEP